MISYYLTDEKIFIVKFAGIITRKNIDQYLNDFSGFNFLPEHLKILYDLSNAELKINMNDLEKFSGVGKEVSKKYKTVQSAFLTNKPTDTAYLILFSQDTAKNNIRKPFSNKNAALEWLLNKTTPYT